MPPSNTALGTGKPRWRMAMSVAGTVNGATLPLLGTSPGFGSYALVPAGASTPQVTVNGGTLTGTSWTAAPGSDTTLFVWGTAAAPQFAALSDRMHRAAGRATAAAAPPASGCCTAWATSPRT